ncbi:MAG: hypothetical protein M1820_003854 [Bogoriella megaspora]|nr:MAG: hypothetical protein M1820_003854 [Bogoriella megaspora]
MDSSDPTEAEMGMPNPTGVADFEDHLLVPTDDVEYAFHMYEQTYDGSRLPPQLNDEWIHLTSEENFRSKWTHRELEA